MAEATEKSAERVYTLDDIQFNEANKTMAALSWIPIVGLVMLFVEKDDLFVRYIAAQSTVMAAVLLLCGIVPVIGWIAAIVAGPLSTVIVVIGIIKALKGERFDVPVISAWALKLIAKI